MSDDVGNVAILLRLLNVEDAKSVVRFVCGWDILWKRIDGNILRKMNRTGCVERLADTEQQAETCFVELLPYHNQITMKYVRLSAAGHSPDTKIALQHIGCLRLIQP